MIVDLIINTMFHKINLSNVINYYNFINKTI